MSDVAGDVVARQRDRAIACILGVKEREVDKYLPRAIQVRLRKVVLDQLNDFTDLVLDVLGALAAGQEDGSMVVLNEHWLEKLGEIHAAVVNGRH